MPEILTTLSMVTCPHGGLANLSTSDHNLFVNASPILVESDIHVIMPGTCSLSASSPPSPCVRIVWSNGSNYTTKERIKLLTKSSLGKCYSANGVLQGSARIISTQHKVISK